MLKIAHDHFHHRLVRAYRPEFLKRHVHAGSFNIDPGIWHACSMNSYPAVKFFFRHIYIYTYTWFILIVGSQKIQKNWQKKNR